MSRAEFSEYHERVAARLRLVASTATTGAV